MAVWTLTHASGQMDYLLTSCASTCYGMFEERLIAFLHILYAAMWIHHSIV